MREALGRGRKGANKPFVLDWPRYTAYMTGSERRKFLRIKRI
jgi:hypothetical protein